MLTINKKCEMWIESSEYLQDDGDNVEKYSRKFLTIPP